MFWGFWSLPASAFQSLDEFKRSQNSDYHIEVQAMIQPESVGAGDTFEFYVRVTLSEGWHIYSMEFQSAEENLATQIRIRDNVFLSRGPWVEPEPRIILDQALQKVVKTH
ncbi:MAG: hypothetical protein GWM98_13130, partial [Nitrospinaceae bacterium]|nr:hypothetical protein [Nitrospinaceae bacterium]NIT82522.1 hypothetical protein [Nitrospinaceae bacterium]NIU96894.1 hypothetical protein [Nitrospinaceae bacterium]NIW06317.1 hypothetical protein [Nitrospinaceae bacterium]NIX34884.1 hypothetical protein [Nitrospinaceae bacterium]